MGKAYAKPESASPEVVRVLLSERSRMPFYGLPVQSHYVEAVIKLDRFSNHLLSSSPYACMGRPILTGEIGIQSMVRRVSGRSLPTGVLARRPLRVVGDCDNRHRFF